MGHCLPSGAPGHNLKRLTLVVVGSSLFVADCSSAGCGAENSSGSGQQIYSVLADGEMRRNGSRHSSTVAGLIHLASGNSDSSDTLTSDNSDSPRSPVTTVTHLTSDSSDSPHQ